MPLSVLKKLSVVSHYSDFCLTKTLVSGPKRRKQNNLGWSEWSYFSNNINKNNNKEKGTEHSADTEKIASTPRPGLEPGPPAHAADITIIIIIIIYQSISQLFWINILLWALLVCSNATVAGPLGEGRIAKKLLVCSRRCQCVRGLIVSGFCLESCLVPIAQVVEQWSCKPQVPGLIPGGDWHFFASHVLASLTSFKLLLLLLLLLLLQKMVVTTCDVHKPP